MMNADKEVLKTSYPTDWRTGDKQKQGVDYF